jgi:hypothetical protein
VLSALLAVAASALWFIEPLGIYWYEPIRVGNELRSRRRVIDYSTHASGGMQIAVVGIDGDLDIAAAGKSGLFLFENLTINR